MPRLSGLLAAAFLTAAVATAAPRTAHAENITGIDPQPLAQALDTWARQTGLQVIYGSDLMKGRNSPGAAAGLNPREALTQILNGSGLAVTWLNERTASIHTVQAAGETSQASLAHLAQAEAGSDPSQGMQAAQPSPSEGEGQGEDKKQTTDTESESARRAIPEILVKGSRGGGSLNMDIERTQDDAQPYVVFDRKAVERSGAPTLESFLHDRLTADPNPLSFMQSAVPNGNASSINLRGLGANQTLILINGRRSASYSLGGTPAQPDINGIPLAAVERIEVLPTTASGIYGGGATGGVINSTLLR